jgi:hypothetical protein
MKKVKISKKAFLSLDQEKLAVYVQDLAPRCEAQPELSIVQPQLDELKGILADYEAKLLLAVQGGRDRTAIKKQALAALLDKLDQLVALVEAARLPEEVLINAGFDLAGAKARYAGAELAKAEIRSARPLGDGVVELRFTHPDYRNVSTHLFEWSADNGLTWQGGTYGRRSPIKLQGLPVERPALVRMCSVGSHGRSSGWTPPVRVFVL